MTDKAAFQATFVTCRQVRDEVHFIFSAPSEQGDEYLRRIGGFPKPGESRWCAIALMEPEPTIPVGLGASAAYSAAEEPPKKRGPGRPRKAPKVDGVEATPEAPKAPQQAPQARRMVLPENRAEYIEYVQQGIEIAKDKNNLENWFLSEKEANLRQACQVGRLATNMLHSLIKATMEKALEEAQANE